MSRRLVALLGLSLLALVAAAELVADDAPQQRGRRGGPGGGMFKARLVPHWFDGDARFWYRNDLAGGQREFVLVDADQATREVAFDHEKLAAALREAGVEDAQAERLPIEALEFKLDEQAVEFRAGDKDWRCDLDAYKLTELADRMPPEDAAAARLGTTRRASTQTGEETELTFINRTPDEVELFWLDNGGNRRSYGKLAPGERKAQHTFAGHVWEVVGGEDRTLARLEAEDSPTTVEIDGRNAPRTSRVPFRGRRGRGGTRGELATRGRSPDGEWEAFVRDGNVFLRAADEDDEVEEIPLSEDGTDSIAYGMLEWAPDSKTLVAFRIEPGDRKEVYLIESSPNAGGRAVLHTRPYALPGDKLTSYELSLFRVEERKQIKPDVERIDLGRPNLHWKADGRHFAYEKVDRGHQRLRVVCVDSHTGDTFNIIDERSETFLWTAHTENVDLKRVNWLDETDEVIYASERDGWRHLYLIDSKNGEIKHPITQGEYVVRGIDRIDEEKRQVWFRASGRNDDQDPYFIHYYRVNFDGTELVALTEGDGTHSIRYSPDRRFLIDTYSRVDQPPIHELRRVCDGALVCPLEEADASELEASGARLPEVFAAKGRDGETDIWGIICRPRDFDPDKRYPIIEQIYAGPQGAFVPKSFVGGDRFSSLTELGFIVVQIDGMGTAHRSKAFHDVCWKNLKDGGLPDRILWIKAAAEKYPYLDTSRVGIYGTSAGGQNAAAAVLFHPEFYKAAVANCGCHDNRLDKASWNEQWMGYPVGPHYSECSNIDNAHRLRGDLFLIAGEMDTNVPPESTIRFADALIKADKDFEFLLVPGGGHGAGSARGYHTRRMHDFFVRHLLGQEPPDRNGEP
jgi:dipeptidyl-peptidase 4